MKFKSAIALTVLSYNVSYAAVTCSDSECKAETMPLLDQMESSVKSKFGSMACVPTSSTMVMEAVFAEKKDVVAGSFTEQIYQQGPYAAILLIGADMKTTSNNGTYVSDANNTFKKIASGFQAKAEALYYPNSSKVITPSMILGEMKSGGLGSILFASYIPNCSSMASGRQTCSFSRSYGHSVAVQAASDSSVSIYDPANEKWTSNLGALSAHSKYKDATLSLASLFKSDARILDENYYGQGEVDLAEYYYGIKVAAASSSTSTPATTTPSTPVVTAPTPAPSPVVTQPSQNSQPSQSEAWKKWADYFKQKGRKSARR